MLRLGPHRHNRANASMLPRFADLLVTELYCRMKVQVTLLRHRGAQIIEQQIAITVPIFGYLIVNGSGNTTQLSLYDRGTSQNPRLPSLNGARLVSMGRRSTKHERLLPGLYDARLVSMHGNRMLFAGIEKTIDPTAAQFLQEWAVTIVEL